MDHFVNRYKQGKIKYGKLAIRICGHGTDSSIDIIADHGQTAQITFGLWVSGRELKIYDLIRHQIIPFINLLQLKFKMPRAATQYSDMGYALFDMLEVVSKPSIEPEIKADGIFKPQE